MPEQPQSRVVVARHRALVALAAGLPLVAGCAAGGAAARLSPSPAGAPASVNASATPSASEEAQILAQYRGFWSNLNAASRLPDDQRRQLLQRFAADPALKSLMAGIARERAKGHVYYGAERPRPRVQSKSVDRRPVAVIDDCQDASGTGLQDLRSGKRLTVGVARNHVVVTMHRIDDGIWRVVFVSYPKTPC